MCHLLHQLTVQSGSSSSSKPAATIVQPVARVHSTQSSQNTAFLTKQNEEKLALAASMISCLNAFLAGELTPPIVSS
ncbi:hypothetical protein Hanom_Chr03g00190281 [Helianthus anomalus]